MQTNHTNLMGVGVGDVEGGWIYVSISWLGSQCDK